MIFCMAVFNYFKMALKKHHANVTKQNYTEKLLKLLCDLTSLIRVALKLITISLA